MCQLALWVQNIDNTHTLWVRGKYQLGFYLSRFFTFQVITRFFEVSVLSLIKSSILLNGVPNMPTFSTCSCAQGYSAYWKIKNIGFNEIKWRFVHWCFQGCWILIWTLIKISFFKIGSKNIKIFYAEGQNNTYKTIKDMSSTKKRKPTCLYGPLVSWGVSYIVSYFKHTSWLQNFLEFVKSW